MTAIWIAIGAALFCEFYSANHKKDRNRKEKEAGKNDDSAGKAAEEPEK